MSTCFLYSNRLDISIRDLLCDVEPYPTVLSKLSEVLRNFIRIRPGEISLSLLELYQKNVVSFDDLDFSLKHFILQAITLLGPETVITVISDAIFPTTPKQLSLINWFHLSSIISGLIVSVRGSVAILKSFINRLLKAVFNPSSLTAENEFVHSSFLLADEEIDPEAIDSRLTESNPDLQLFTAALLFARCLCAADVRITGLSYKHWWLETFCQRQRDAAAILRTRADLSRFVDLLLSLLPWEQDPRLLHIQLLSRPLCSFTPAVKKSVTLPHAPGKMEASVEEEIMTGDDGLLKGEVLAELQDMDSAYVDSCCQRWNDYIEIGRGRLAELRSSNPPDELDQMPNVGSPILIGEEDATPGWEEVCDWLKEVTNRSEGGEAFRIPHSLNESQLFRPRYLRETLIPALLNAPELNDAPAHILSARNLLIGELNRSGLSHLLKGVDSQVKKPSKKRPCSSSQLVSGSLTKRARRFKNKKLCKK